MVIKMRIPSVRAMLKIGGMYEIRVQWILFFFICHANDIYAKVMAS